MTIDIQLHRNEWHQVLFIDDKIKANDATSPQKWNSLWNHFSQISVSQMGKYRLAEGISIPCCCQTMMCFLFYGSYLTSVMYFSVRRTYYSIQCYIFYLQHYVLLKIHAVYKLTMTENAHHCLTTAYIYIYFLEYKRVLYVLTIYQESWFIHSL